MEIKEVLRKLQNNRIKEIGYIGEINHIDEKWIFDVFIEMFLKLSQTLPTFKFDFEVAENSVIDGKKNTSEVFEIGNVLSENYTMENFKIKKNFDIWNEYLKPDLSRFFYKTLSKAILMEDFEFNIKPENAFKQNIFVIEMVELHHSNKNPEYNPDGAIFLSFNIRSEIR